MSLPRGRVAAIPRSGKLAQVTCVSGMVWLTGEDDPEDHILRGRSSLLVSGRGLVVEALDDSVVRIVPGALQPGRAEAGWNLCSLRVFLRMGR